MEFLLSFRFVIIRSFRKAGLAEKVDILHEINVCREAKGDAAASKAVTCIDAIRHGYVVSNYCNESGSCTQSR